MFFFGLSFFTEQRDFGKSAEHFSNPLNCQIDRLFFFEKNHSIVDVILLSKSTYYFFNIFL